MRSLPLAALAAMALPLAAFASSPASHRATQPSEQMLRESRNITLSGRGMSADIADCIINIQGVPTDIGDISVSLTTDADGQNVMTSTFTLDPAFQHLTDWMEFHWAQIITQDDCPAEYFGMPLPFPHVDPPADGWDYMYYDGAMRMMPDNDGPNYDWFIDDEPWYYDADGEAANNMIGESYEISDAAGKCRDAGRTTFKTWLTAKTNSGMGFCLIAGFEWSISTAGNTLADEGAPAQADADELESGLENGQIEGWEVGPKCDVDCKPTVWDCVYSSLGNVFFSAGVWTRDTIPIGETFPGGVVPPPGIPLYDHKVLPQQPNDWHWTATIPCGPSGETVVNVWFENFDWFDPLEVQLFCVTIPIPGPYMLHVDVGHDHFMITDANNIPFAQGPWSLYPKVLPPNVFQITGDERQNFLDAPPPCPGDVDGDNFVGFGDLNLLLAAYNSVVGETSYNPGADFDQDNDVDFSDLNTLLGNYNQDCLGTPGG